MHPAFQATRQLAAFPAPGAGVFSPSALLDLCMGFLRPERAARAPVAVEGIDPSTGLYERGALMAAAGRMLSQAQAQDNVLSVMVIEFNDLKELHDVYGGAISRKLIAKLILKIRELAGSRGLAGRTGSAQFTVVLPMRSEKAIQVLQKVMGKPARIEFDAGDSEIVLVPDVVVDCTDSSTGSVEAFWRELCVELERSQRRELRRQHYLQRERERHSRPMSLAAQA